MAQASYPYAWEDRLTSTVLNNDFEFSPDTVPPAGSGGGAGMFKYWVDTTDDEHPVLRQCRVPEATAGVYVPAEWITIGTIGVTDGKFHFNSNTVDFVTPGIAPGSTTVVFDNIVVNGTTTLHGDLSSDSDAVFTGTVTAGGLTTGGNLSVNGTGNIAGGLTIAGGGLSVTGDVSISDDLTVAGLGGISVPNSIVDADGYNLDGAVFADRITDYNVLHDYAGNAAIKLGATHSYYQNDHHVFTNPDGSATWLTIEAGHIDTPEIWLGGHILFDTDGTTNALYDPSGFACIGVTHLGVGPGGNDYINTQHLWYNRALVQLMSLNITGLNVAVPITGVGTITTTSTISGGDVNATNNMFAAGHVNTLAYYLRGIQFAMTDAASVYTVIGDPGLGSQNIVLDAGAVTNYYNNEIHTFRNRGTLATYAIFNSGGTYNQTGSWLVISDDGVKENVEPYEVGLAAITQLNPVSFNYKAGTTFAVDSIQFGIRYGLMSSNVKPVIPEMVAEAEIEVDGIPIPVDSLMPTHLNYVLINAVKELAEQDSGLADRITAVENDLGDNPPYAPLASPALTGIPTAPTAPRSTATQQLATTGFVRLGTDTNDSAPTGHIGEYRMAQTLSTAAIPLTTGIDAIIVTLSLPPGDWDVWGSAGYTMSNPNNAALRAWVNAGGGDTAPPIDQAGGNVAAAVVGGSTLAMLPVSPMRVPLATTTTIKLGTTPTMQGGTIAAWGKIMARRAR